MAIRAGSQIVNECPYLLKSDIKMYFPSVDHRILKNRIQRKIKCGRTLDLIEVIIDNSNDQNTPFLYFPGDDLFTPIERRKGLPIGNLTSQLFANVYLDDLDHFVVQRLRHKQYARYVDDFLIGDRQKEGLKDVRIAIKEFLEGLRLKIHEHKTVVFPAKRGFTFLGFRFYPGRVLAGKRCGKRFKARLKQLQKEYAAGRTDLKTIKHVISSYNGHLAHGATVKLRTRILEESPFVKHEAEVGEFHG